MIYLGIDIGGTAVKYGIVTREGEILHKGEYPVAFDNYETPILETVLSTSESFMHDHKVRPDSLSGIGVSATGQIDSDKGIVAGAAGHIKNWEGARIKKELQDKYGRRTPICVNNDANCVALGELWLGAAKGCRDVIVITVGTGIGGGVITDGRLLQGDGGIAGELGHFSIDRRGPLCSCGNRGCFEQYASMTALIREVKNELWRQEGPFDEQLIDGKYIFGQVRKSNPVIMHVVEQWIENISAGLVSLVHIFNPEKIIIGGGVSVQEELFIAKVRERVTEKVMPNFGKRLVIERAKLGNDAGLTGALVPLF